MRNLQTNNNKAILIAGLTASGKSQLALNVARHYNAQGNKTQKAVIINADSMQVYEDLRILTARPSAEEEAREPHYLYGFVPPSRRFSVGAWLEAVESLLRRTEMQNKILIFVGGTGLYFRALLGGLAEIPPIGADVRAQGQQILEQQGLSALYADLQAADSEGAAKLEPNDSQRILRAWEVLRQTGKPLHYWQMSAKPPLIDSAQALKLALLPPREEINARINARVDAMAEEGAAKEVAALLAQKLDPELPAMKAAGARAFAAYINGDTDLQTAIHKTQQETRQYAKRQRTWFSHQLAPDWQIFSSAAQAWEWLLPHL